VAVLTEKGYSAVGIDEILRLAQVPKGSFYYYFDSKEAFGQALIASYAGYFATKLDRWLLDAAAPPLQRLRHFVADARAGMARHGFKRGCLVGNLGQEMGTLPESFRAQLQQVFLDWQARTAACLAEAQRAGEIAPQLDCAAMAHFFWIGWEGAVLRAKLERSPEALDVYAHGFFELMRVQP
jgi:TetR/AcrR family transcriptional repressor of nem operon